MQRGVLSSFLLATLAAMPAFAQNAEPGAGVVRGVVRDEFGAPVSGAAVDAACGYYRQHVDSEADGSFELAGLPIGRCTISAHTLMFQVTERAIDVSAAGVHLDVTLRMRAFGQSVVVTPSRGVAEASAAVPETVSLVSRDELDMRAFQLLPLALREEPGVLVQQTTTAQASPIVRGFTGQSNVYLLDGVRFNVSTWRGGPSQYTAWINGGVADQIEIMRGPASVQYGSDALGGTFNILSAVPALTSSVRAGGHLEADVASAMRSSGGQAVVQVQSSVGALRFGTSTQRVGNLRTGRGVDSHAAVTRFLGLPSDTLAERLPSSGFKQSGAFLTGQLRAGRQARVSGVYLHENQVDASRYDRIAGGDGLYRSGFAPQTLDFGFVRYRREKTGVLDGLSATVSVNRQKDGRFEQTRPTTVLDEQDATTTALGYQVEARRRLVGHDVAGGAEVYAERIDAVRRQVNPVTGAVVANRPDVPDDTRYTTLGLFVQDAFDVVPGRWSVRGGVRYGRFRFRTDADARFGVIDESVSTSAVTFNAGSVWTVTPNLALTFTAGRGFRAPNAADFGSVGLTGGGGFEVAPSAAAGLNGLVGSTGAAGAVSTGVAVPGLRPEVVYSFEPGVRVQTGRVTTTFSLYDVEYLDAIQRRAIVFPSNVVGSTLYGFPIVRQDATGLAYIQQDIRPIATRVNADHARIVGFEVDSTARLTSRWSARVYMSMTNGHLLETGESLRRMPPPMGGGLLRWSGSRVTLDGVVTFALTQRRFNSGDVTDARIGGTRTRASIANYFNGTAVDLGLVRNGVLVATGETLTEVQNRVLGSAASAPLFQEGPGFFVLGARANVRLTSSVRLIVIGENLTDRNYRLYGSGADAPGVNVQARLRVGF